MGILSVRVCAPQTGATATWLQEGRKVKVQRCLLPNLKMNERKIIWGGEQTNKTEPARVKLHRAPKQFPLSELTKLMGF